MAKRPAFNLPSTEGGASAPKTDWVYRSDAKTDAKPAAKRGSTPPPAKGRTTPVEPDAPWEDRLYVGNLIIDRYATYAGASTFIPLPYADLVAIGGLQLKMIGELCRIHGVLFNNEVGKSLLAALAGSVGSVRVASTVSGWFLRYVPVVGVIGSVVAWPAIGYGATWAIGRVFAMHFESGGTMLDFDAVRMREHYERELTRSK